MNRKTITVLAGGALAIGIVAAGATVVSATSDDDANDTPITGPALEKASAAALDHVGEGRVTETEVGDEEGYYEVEVTLDDGSQVDVHLTEDFAVIGTEADDESEED